MELSRRAAERAGVAPPLVCASLRARESGHDPRRRSRPALSSAVRARPCVTEGSPPASVCQEERATRKHAHSPWTRPRKLQSRSSHHQHPHDKSYESCRHQQEDRQMTHRGGRLPACTGGDAARGRASAANIGQRCCVTALARLLHHLLNVARVDWKSLRGVHEGGGGRNVNVSG